jgi:ankyrin repeat protein
LYSYTPLHNAAVSGHIEICELLLEHRADVHTIASGETPLRSAMRAGHSKICDLLLKHNADLLLKDEKRDGKLIKLKSQKLTEDLIVTSVEAIRAQRVDLAIPLDVSYMEMLPTVISATLDGYVIVDTFPSEIIGEMKPVLGRLDYQP